MSNNNMVYIRTDKNGTKIYHDYTCPRCGGAGGADQWIYTGWTCYECGGTGRVSILRSLKNILQSIELSWMRELEREQRLRGLSR
mgnify:CR=1 FL=1